MKKLLLILLLPISASAFSGKTGTQFKYFVNANGDLADTKGLSIASQDKFYFLRTRLEGGFWVDRREGGRSSGFGFAGIGVEPQYGPMYVSFFQSAGLITHTDAYLGGHFQFMEELGVGFRDKTEGTSVGLFFKHVSSAGLGKPNLGRDYFGVQVMIPL